VEQFGRHTRQSRLVLAGTQDMEACMRVSKAVEHVLGVNEDPRTQAQHLQVTWKHACNMHNLAFCCLLLL